MKITLAIIALVALFFVFLNRDRIYVRDPLGTVYRNDVKQQDMVFINFSNDVLVQTGSLPRLEQYLVQKPDRLPGTPVEMTCVYTLVCFSPDRQVPIESWHGGTTRAVMSSREVSFKDPDGVAIRIALH